ncbi:MAG TPA: SDR family oxidoreductase [Ktedonobacteraceae bacterium]|nr:SDR family oxidoreductase [Ktedonobacteraceae bacterium]
MTNNSVGTDLSRPLDKKTVVITGAGRGIGRTLALGFASQGATVLVHHGHSQRAAEDVVRQIKSAGGAAMLAQADISSAADVARLVKDAVDKLGPIDVWINNAGATANSEETIGLSDLDIFERLMAVDVLGTWLCCRAVASYMSVGACILTTGWDHAFVGAPGMSNQLYSVSKGAIIAMTRSFARELAPRIRVNCIAPGWIDNDWSTNRPPSFRERVAQTIPLKHWGTPEDVLSAALFLSSPAAALITGQVLLVNGGDVMR